MSKRKKIFLAIVLAIVTVICAVIAAVRITYVSTNVCATAVTVRKIKGHISISNTVLSLLTPK